MEHRWWASSLTLNTGSNSVAWTIVVRAVPEIGDGAIQFTTLNKAVDGKVGSFSGMQSLRSFDKAEAPEVAWTAASAIAQELLPAANRRCDDIDAELEEAQVVLEQLRKELTKEIERVRNEKTQRREEARRRKQLVIEVEG
jgi:tryptophanyl-tRNA synthetase